MDQSISHSLPPSSFLLPPHWLASLNVKACSPSPASSGKSHDWCGHLDARSAHFSFMRWVNEWAHCSLTDSARSLALTSVSGSRDLTSGLHMWMVAPLRRTVSWSVFYCLLLLTCCCLKWVKNIERLYKPWQFTLSRVWWIFSRYCTQWWTQGHWGAGAKHFFKGHQLHVVGHQFIESCDGSSRPLSIM